MIYTVHLKQSGLESGNNTGEPPGVGTLEVVPESIAKWAIILPPLWLLVHKLWWPLTFYIAVTVFLLVLLTTPIAVSVLFLGGFPGLYLLLEGHQLRRNKLEETGYEQIGVVEASNPDIAIERFIAQFDFESAPVDPKPSSSVTFQGRSSTTPAFGLFSDHGY